jgi:hypothetical protein
MVLCIGLRRVKMLKARCIPIWTVADLRGGQMSQGRALQLERLSVNWVQPPTDSRALSLSLADTVSAAIHNRIARWHLAPYTGGPINNRPQVPQPAPQNLRARCLSYRQHQWPRPCRRRRRDWRSLDLSRVAVNL